MLAAANLLGEATSPYLIQHAGNPVHWRSWGAQALEEAKRRDRPILLSVGYAACHWCHVMAHESFEDPEIAALMNQLFVNVKVDREERPDVDHIYMSALHAMGEQGGWPLTMFLTPDGAPIYGGTYWPPVSRWGRPSFRQVLKAVDDAWRDRRDALQAQGAKLVQHLSEIAAAAPGENLIPDDLTRVSESLLGIVDPVYGGIGAAPKFPNAPIFRFFWSESFRRSDPRLRASVRSLLGALGAGGIYDHLGGGFARYSTDAHWHVPHFEKMLYDNAQILELLALAYAQTPNPLYADRARETFDWVKREMSVDGAFAASLDADTEGEEGRFYVWSADEVDRLLGEDSAAFKAVYDVRPDGNWEGRNVLRRVSPPGDEASETRLAASRARLFAEREKRPRPARDDKVLADWNGLMIAALANASQILGEPSWLAMAERAFAFIARAMTHGDRLGHSWRQGKLKFPGLASDFAAMIRASLALHEATGRPDYLQQALTWQQALDRDHADAAAGTYYLTAADAEGLVIRPASTADEATPNHNAVAAQNLIRLSLLTGDDQWRDKADRLIAAIAPAAVDNLYMHMALLNAVDLRLRAAEIVVTGEGPRADQLLNAARQLPALDRIVLHAGSADTLPQHHPARDKIAAVSEPSAFVCIGETCSLPVTDPAALLNAVNAARQT